MCGIVGQAFLRDRISKGTLTAMRESMSHRGPDDAGEWYSPDYRIGFAHRRLAIIDLSPRARQPMQDITGKLTIVFNGEIYNFLDLRRRLEKKGHQFRSNSDTEVILAAYREWGTNCLQKLNGMFAFCIYDEREHILFLARDRAGEKPLYYRHGRDMLAFASELRALAADPGMEKTPNLDAVNYFLAYGHVPCPLSILDGVSKLPQAHAMVYCTDSGSLRVWKYWDLPEPIGDDGDSVEELRDELTWLLRDSVRRQLISDVPIAVLLSGGCDSSLITALAQEATNGPLRTFTVTFPGHGQHDEARFAEIVSKHLGTEHTEIPAQNPSPDLMMELAAKLDEPCADHAMIPTYLVSKAIRGHAKVVLTGDGGDELFGGYPHYSLMLKLERLRRLAPSSLRALLSEGALRAMPVGTRFRNHIIGFKKDYPHTIAHINLYFDQHSRRRLLNPDIVNEIDTGLPERQKAERCRSVHSALRQAMQSDFLTTLADCYLVKVDRASMLASIESRSPLLDYRIIEFAFRTVPDRHKVTNGRNKILLRSVAEDLLPETLNLNRKQGFIMPISKWFQGRMGQSIQSVFGDSQSSLFDSGYIAKLFQCNGKQQSNWNRLYALTILELWCRNYGVTL